MKLLPTGATAMIAISLCGCYDGKPSLQNASHHGRYVGIGIYTPEEQWTKMVGADAQKSTDAARTLDDQAIIVVEDSETGEIRACGDLTGYCIGTNPWKKMLAASQVMPINLTEHVMPPKAQPAAHK